jgi:hypothetical protein
VRKHHKDKLVEAVLIFIHQAFSHSEGRIEIYTSLWRIKCTQESLGGCL